MALNAAVREFRYQALWEKDIRLRRLSARYKVVRDHDLYCARQGPAAVSAPAAYRSVLDQYASRVDAADSRS